MLLFFFLFFFQIITALNKIIRLFQNPFTFSKNYSSILTGVLVGVFKPLKILSKFSATRISFVKFHQKSKEFVSRITVTVFFLIFKSYPTVLYFPLFLQVIPTLGSWKIGPLAAGAFLQKS